MSPRGGRRQGTPGQLYPNRSDLRENPRVLPVQAPPAAYHGQRKQLEDLQRAAPMGPPPGPTAAPAGAGRTTGGAPAALPWAGPLVPLDAPTERPDEPLTAGLPIGPGAGPEALLFNRAAPPGPMEEIAFQLRALYLHRPTEELRALLEEIDDSA